MGNHCVRLFSIFSLWFQLLFKPGQQVGASIFLFRTSSRLSLAVNNSAAKRRDGQAYQFEMLLGKWNSDNGNGKQKPKNKVT